jgi:hypothetical protein
MYQDIKHKAKGKVEFKERSEGINKQIINMLINKEKMC